MSDEPGLMDVISRLTSNTDEVWKHLVCPPKQRYSTESLGPPTQMWGGNTFRRHDLNFRNSKGLKISYSLFLNESVENEEDSYTIVYLHSHGGCKIEGYHLLKVFGRKTSAHLCLFDFAGCGHSDGDHLSMGAEEPDDVCSLLQVLARDFGVKQFAIWGRSMGAAVALLTMPRLSGVFTLVLDSPFSEVRNVYRNAVKQRMALPGVLIDLVFSYANSEIKRIYGFDVSELRPFDNAKRINVPTVLMGAQEDKITSYDDLIELYNAIPQPEDLKVVVPCKGNHNDDREFDTLKSTMEFIQIIFARAKLEARGAKGQRTLGGMPKHDRKPVNRLAERAVIEDAPRESNYSHHHHSLPRKEPQSLRSTGQVNHPSFKAHSVNPSMQRSITAGAMEDSRRNGLNSSFSGSTTTGNLGGHPAGNPSSKVNVGPHSGRRLPLGNFQYSLGSLGQNYGNFGTGQINQDKLRTIFDVVQESPAEQTSVVDLTIPVPPTQQVETHLIRSNYKPLSQANQPRLREPDIPNDMRPVRSQKTYIEEQAQLMPQQPESHMHNMPPQPGWILLSQGYSDGHSSQQTAPTLMASSSNSNYATKFVNQQELEPRNPQMPTLISPTASLNLQLPSQQKNPQLRELSPRPPQMMFLGPNRSRGGTNLGQVFDQMTSIKPNLMPNTSATRDYHQEKFQSQSQQGGFQNAPPPQQLSAAPKQPALQSPVSQTLHSILNYQSAYATAPKPNESNRSGQRNPLSRTFGDFQYSGNQGEPNTRIQPMQVQYHQPNGGYAQQPPGKIYFNTPSNPNPRDIPEAPSNQPQPFEYQTVYSSEPLGRIDPTRSINQTAFPSMADNQTSFQYSSSQQQQGSQQLASGQQQFAGSGAASKQSYQQQQTHKPLLPQVIPQHVRQPASPGAGQGVGTGVQQAPYASIITSQSQMDKFFGRTLDTPSSGNLHPTQNTPGNHNYEQYSSVGPANQGQPQGSPILIQSQTQSGYSLMMDPRSFATQFGHKS